MDLSDNSLVNLNIDSGFVDSSTTAQEFFGRFCKPFLDGELGALRSSNAITELLQLRYQDQYELSYTTWLHKYVAKQGLACIADNDAVLISTFLNNQPGLMKAHLRLRHSSSPQFV
jgi:hypothetical protein